MLEPSTEVDVLPAKQPLNGVRVLLVVENLSVPADRRVWQEARALQRAGADVTVICPQGHARDREPVDHRDGIAIRRFPQREGRGAFGYVAEYAVAVVRIRRLAKLLAADRPFDVVHVANPPDLLLPVLRFMKRRGARFVFDHHDLSPELYRSRFERPRDPLYWALRAFERITFLLADVVVATNESYRQLALKRGHVKPANVHVVRNGPDLERFRRTPIDPALRRGKNHLLAYLGAMAPQDGLDVAIKALAVLAERRDDWHAVFMGDGPVRPALIELSHELRIDDRVDFPGWVDEATFLPVLSTADICLSPEPPSPLNDHSTMIKVAEYMALGAPVVAFDLPETRFTAGEAAVYAAGNNPADFAAAIDTLLSNADIRRAKAREALGRVRDRLSWEHSGRVLVQAYVGMLDRTGAAGNSADEAPAALNEATAVDAGFPLGGRALGHCRGRRFAR